MAVQGTEARLAQRNLHWTAQNQVTSLHSTQAFGIELRKKKRLESSMHKRLKPQSNPIPQSFNEALDQVFARLEITENKAKVFHQIDSILINSEDLQQEIRLHHVQALIDHLKNESQENQILITNILINLTFRSSQFNESMIRAGLFLTLSRFLSAHRSELCSNSLWVLTNMMQESESLRRRFLSSGLLDSLVELIKLPSVPGRTLSVALWSLSMFGRLVCTSKQNSFLVSFLKGRLDWRNIEDCENSLNILFNLVNEQEDLIGGLLDSDTTSLIVQDLSSGPATYYRLHLISAILAAESTQFADLLIQAGLLKEVFSCLDHSCEKIMEQAYFCFSNLAAGNYAQKQGLINEQLVLRMARDLDHPSQVVCRDSAIFLRNLVLKVSEEDCSSILGFGVLQVVAEKLGRLKEHNSFREVLQFLYHLTRGLGAKGLEQLRSSSFVEDFSDVLNDCRYSESAETILKNLSEKELSAAQPHFFSI